MQITKDQLIAGQPALKVRSFLRTYSILSFYTSEFEKVLNLSPAEAEDFACEMVNLGFFTQTTHCPINNRPVYQVGDQGHRLANASAAKPITRKTADRVLQEFIERVRIVNASTLYAYKVETAVLFGIFPPSHRNDLVMPKDQPSTGTAFARPFSGWRNWKVVRTGASSTSLRKGSPAPSGSINRSDG